MSEYMRGVRVRIEGDTNKQTYTLALDDLGVEDARRQVNEFLSAHA